MFTFTDLTIRLVEDKDLELIRALRNAPSTWEMLTDVNFIDAESQKQWFQRIRVAQDKRYYVIYDESHDFIGIVRTDEIDRQNRSMRIGADIATDLRGKGYGARTYQLLKKYCFDYLNMHRVWLAVLETNSVAINLYAKQGFKPEGRYREAIFRNGKYHDYIVMSLLEHEYRDADKKEET